MNSHEQLHLFRVSDQKLTGTALSHDGQMLAVGTQAGEALIWNVITGKLELVLSGSPVDYEELQFEPNDRYLISASSKRIVIRELPDRDIDRRIAQAESAFGLSLHGVNLSPTPSPPNLFGLSNKGPTWSVSHPFYWLKAAEGGGAKAMVQLGICYDRSEEIELASQWYRKAADAGDPDGNSDS